MAIFIFQGTCFLNANGPQCKCHEGYTGPRCELDSCTNNTCLNGGKSLTFLFQVISNIYYTIDYK